MFPLRRDRPLSVRVLLVEDSNVRALAAGMLPRRELLLRTRSVGAAECNPAYPCRARSCSSDILNWNRICSSSAHGSSTPAAATANRATSGGN